MKENRNPRSDKCVYEHLLHESSGVAVYWRKDSKSKDESINAADIIIYAHIKCERYSIALIDH